MNLVQMSISGALLILAVVLIRLAALRAVPKRTFLFLWALVLVRLLVPFPPILPLPSPLSAVFSGTVTATAAPGDNAARPTAMPTAGREPLPQSPQTAAPITSAAPATHAPVQPAVTAAPAVTARPRGNISGEGPGFLPSPQTVLAGKAALLIWLLGMIVTAAVFAFLYGVSYGRFRRALPLEGPAAEGWLAAHPAKRKLSLRTLAGLSSPLTYGILRPVILLPEGLDLREEGAAFALEHEYVHARRLDALWKLLLALTLSVHWFNPFVWLMWFLANRDLELSCDEEVLRRYETDQRGDYARALLAMEEKRALLPPLHSGFGSGATKERILSIMKYKKATVLSVSLAVVLVAVLAACALGGRADKEPAPPTSAPGAPGADLTVGPVRWGMSPEEVRRALTDTKGDVGPVSADGKITLSAEFCSCPAEISWCFADDGNGLFLNGIEVLFTDAEAFDREAVAKALEENWGARCKYGKARKYSPGVDGPDIAPKEDWYWRTADFSDEYGWKSGVTARFLTKDGSTSLLIDATGRSQAEGRLTTLPRTEETKWEVDRLMGLATRIRPSAASWEYFDPEYMHSDGGSEQASVRVYTPRDRDLAEKLFDPYSWLTVDYRGDQFDPADASDILLDGSLVPTVSVFTPESIFEEGWQAVFTNRTNEDLTLYFPEGLLAERDGVWVRPRFHYDGTYDYISPTLAPGESYTFDCQFELRHACYDLAPGRYMLTMAAYQGGRQLTYGAVVWITDGPAPKDGEASIPFESGGYTLSVPAEYAESLTVETEKMGDHWETLFTVTEKASYEAGQKLSPGNEDGLGWLFSIARISEDELGKLMMWDMSGIDAFAREQSGDYLLLLRPTDVRFLPNGEDDEARMDQWEAMQDWTWASMPERFLEDNADLTPCRHGGSFVENALARVLYYDPAEYGEADRPLIRYGDGEGVDPLGTSQAREDARRMLWEYSMEGAAAAKDFPETGASVTLTDPLGIIVTFRRDSDVVRVTYNGDTHQYFRLKSLLLHGNPIGTMACGWYFDAAATLSGETASYRNGDFTLRLPAEYASQLVVRTEWDRDYLGETLFRVSERGSRDRWAAAHDTYTADATDGWLFSILRVERESWARSVTGGSSGVFVFAEDSEGCCYVCSYPIWLTFQPEEGATADRESEAYRQYRTLTAALRSFDTEQHFISDNSLTARYFTDVQQYFLCFAIYGYEDCNIRQGLEGEAFDPRRSEEALYYLKLLLWDVEYDALDSVQEPAEEPIVLELEREYSQLLSRLLFWPDSDLAALENSGGRQYYACKARGAEYGNRAYSWAATCLEMARIGVALPPVSGRTVSYESQGLTLTIPEEYDELLIVDTEPELQGALFRVMQRSSWENGQKAHPGEDWGDGLLFVLRRYDEKELLWELRAHPTPASLVGRDREGNYYLIGYPSDVRFVGEDPQIITPSDPGLPEWKALNFWAEGIGDAICAANADALIPMEKAFCELEHVLAVLLEDGAETPLPEYFRFVSPEGAVTEAADVAEKFDYARRILLEGSSFWLPEDTPPPEGRPIRLETPGVSVNSRLLFTFWPGSDIFREECFYSENGAHSSRMLRMTLPKDGPNIGYLMVRWYGKAAADVVHHVTAEIVDYGNDTICIKVTDPGDSRLPVGFEMYVGGSYLSEDGGSAPAFELPVGCIVEVEYRGEVVGDEFRYCGPTGGTAGYIRVVEP